jgi:hypothetical protein
MQSFATGRGSARLQGRTGSVQITPPPPSGTGLMRTSFRSDLAGDSPFVTPQFPRDRNIFSTGGECFTSVAFDPPRKAERSYRLWCPDARPLITLG